MEEGVTGASSKFADDTKMAGFAGNDEQCREIQQDIDRLENWAESWQMEFNPDKCGVMHFGRNNGGRSYTINGRAIKSIETQRDRGVQFHKSLKVATQVEKMVKKAYGMLPFI